ncbi:MAG: hypothetical protein Q8R16_00545, partial [bacterium]|nr:hypothetical protein [bacterium]
PMDAHGKGPGMWYDWTMNGSHTHAVAVVPSTTGLNPITFQKADKLRLERYRDRCPVHDVEFEGERFCGKCNDGKGLQWPPQNYVAAPNVLWWDGFRRPDGTVRQFWFSDDVLRRDVGVAVLGADRVPAFGFAIFRATQPKPVPVYAPLLRGAGPMGYPQLESFGGPMKSFGLAGDFEPFRGMGSTLGSPPRVAAVRRATGSVGASQATPSSVPPAAPARQVNEIRREAVERTVAVAAGSGISQDLQPDPRSLDEWQPEPAAVITVYFVPEETAVAILQGPKRDLTGPREGALASIPVALGTE